MEPNIILGNTPRSPKKSKWNLLRNVVRAVTLFKSHEANQPEINELISEIKEIPTDKAYQLKRRRTRENSAYLIAIKDLRREQSLMKCVERGNSSDLEQIKLEIDQDPYKLLRNPNHPLALINKRNRDGQTPLYIACKHGNIEVFNLLMRENADYLLLSLVDGEEESNLEVSIRWGHKAITEELLKKEWPKSILNKAKKLCRSSEFLALFNNLEKKKGKWCFCCLKKQ